MNTKYTPIILGGSVLLISVLLFTFLFSSNSDMDNDGVVDDKDQCPQIYGPIENYGCPNKKSPRSDNGKSIDDSNSYFEKQVDSLMNGTMICPDSSCFYDKDGNRNVIVGNKIQYGDNTWYWYTDGVKKKVNYPDCLNEYFGNLKAEIDKQEAEEEDTGGNDDGGNDDGGNDDGGNDDGGDDDGGVGGDDDGNVGGDDDGGVGGDDDGDVGGDDDGGDGQTTTGQTPLETLENELKFWKKELPVADFNDSYMRENFDIAFDFLRLCEKLEKQYDPKYKPTYDEIKKIFN